MLRRLTSAAAGVATLAAAGGIVLAGAGAASATTLTFEPDPNSQGTLTFYDAQGHVVTGGTLPSDTTTTKAIAAYVVGSKNIHGTDSKAQLVFATPIAADPSTWSSEAINTTTFNPAPSGLPANLQNLGGKPLFKGNDATDLTLYQWSDPVDGVPNQATSGPNVGIYQVRLYTSAPTAAGSIYDSADVYVDRTAHTWSLVYPTVSTTSTTLTATPASPQTSPATSTTLQASVTPSTVPGTVTFFDGSTQVGSPVAVSAGKASTAVTPTLGTHSYTARFDPTPGYSDGSVGTSASTATLNEYQDSTSAALPYTVAPPADSTSTAVAVTHGATVADAVTATATITDTTTPASTVNGGTVQFTYTVDSGSGASSPANLGSPVTVSGGTATLSLPNGLPYTGAGPFTYVISAAYTGVTGTFGPSTGSASPFSVTAPASDPKCSDATSGYSCTDQQNIQATIQNGTLSISTPYTAASPLDLGNLTLTNDDSEFTGQAPFGDATVGYIRVTDTRAGQPIPWTANALASALTGASKGGKINAQNVGLTGLAVAGTAGSGFDATAANLTTFPNPAPNPAVLPGDTGSLGLGGTTPHVFAKAVKGLGTVDLKGTLTINAPTTTAADTYKGTITFTVG